MHKLTLTNVFLTLWMDVYLIPHSLKKDTD